MGQNDEVKPPTWRRPTIALVGVLVVLSVAALAVTASVWPTVGTSGSRSNILFEAAIQVIGVAIIGGVATFVFTVLKEQYASTLADRDRERERQRTIRDKALERLREDFEVRADLLKRTASCAQKMYVMCQRVSRLQRWDGVDHKVLDAAMAQLHEAYLTFSPEAAALETELEARFGAVPAGNVGDDETAAAEDAQLGDDSVTLAQVGELAHEPAELWHQLWDLLTVYYFALDRRFPGGVLRANSAGAGGRVHSGLPLAGMVRKGLDPTDDELKVVRRSIRKTFVPAQRALGASVRSATLLED